MAGASSGLSSDPLKPSGRTIRSPAKSSSTVSSIDALIDAPNVVNRPTTAVPTISAEALAAVRRGLRMALRRARRPVTPRRAAGPAPITAAAGRATTGPSTTAPTSRPSDPSPARARADSGVDVAVTRAAAPAPATSTPTTARHTEVAGAVDGDVTQGRQRGDAGRLDGGPDAGDERRADADDRAGDDRAGADHEVGVGHLEAGLHDRLEDAGDADAGGEADGRRQHADGQRLGGNGQDDLAARRADGPHQCGLSGALGDEDRERVVDAEGGDDDGDAGERQQQRLEEAEEVALDVALLLGA